MQGITCDVCKVHNESRDMNHNYREINNELYKQSRCMACNEELTDWEVVTEVEKLKLENEKLKELNEFMRGYFVYFSENNWYGDEAKRQHEHALEKLLELESELNDA